jgi:prevent-host-death family protein
MTTTVNVYEAKARLSQLLALAESGEEVVIARNGTPVVRLTRMSQDPGSRRPGAWKGMGSIADDFDETPPEVIDDFYSGSSEPA